MPNSWNDFIATQTPRLHNWLKRKGCAASDIDDVSQDTFMRLIRYPVDALADRRMFTIARRLLIDRHKKMKPEALPEIAESELRAADYDSAEALRIVTDCAVAKLLALLPEKQRVAFVLRYRDGLKPEEIASIVGAPVETIKSRIQLAARKLREATERMERE